MKQISDIEFEMKTKFLNVSSPIKVFKDATNAAIQKLASSGNLLKDADVDLVQLSSQCNNYEKIR